MSASSRPRPATAFVLALSLWAQHAAAAPRCLTPPERTAFEVRLLQTEMMVAALTCRGVGGRDFSAQYERFVETNREGLRAQATIFRGHFRRSFPAAAAETQLDRYVTSLANDLSRASMAGTGVFCPQQDELFARAARTRPDDLAGFAAERAAAHPLGVQDCAAPRETGAGGQPPRR